MLLRRQNKEGRMVKRFFAAVIFADIVVFAFDLLRADRGKAGIQEAGLFAV